jgi:diguanylate cyclase (GGDEF)-like protein/PAS domain S-box-containing protein
MKIFLNPVARITLGLVSLTVSLLLAAQLIGLLPDRADVELEARKKLCEALAMQLSWSASRNDVRSIQNTLDAVVQRNDELLSAAFLTAQDVVKASAGEHEDHWEQRSDGSSTSTQVQVPIFHNGASWGVVQLSFLPLKGSSGWLLLTQSAYTAMIFVALMGFLFYFVFLRRALRELDPSAVIPDRVRAAFDVLAEGLFIVDDEGRIVLANSAFCDLTGLDPENLVGADASRLGWLSPESGSKLDSFPWEEALMDGKARLSVPMMVFSKEGENRALMVNGSPILDGQGKPRGALATFDDVTVLERRNTDLKRTLDNLNKSRAEVKRQNEELRYLATRDSLTGCLNRRAAFERFDHMLDAAARDGSSLSCIMADIDHFKEVNDRYGHTAGDKVIQFVAKIMHKSVGSSDIVARYGGEEFCVIMPGRDAAEAWQLAEKIRTEIKERFVEKFSSSRKLTISLGVATHSAEVDSPIAFINRADEALYLSKSSGRNKVSTWDEVVAQSAQKGSEEDPNDKSMLIEVPDFSQAMTHIATMRGKKSSFGKSDDEWKSSDEVVGMPNRMLFYDRVGQAVTAARREQDFVGILNVGIDIVQFTNGDSESITDESISQKAFVKIGEILHQVNSAEGLDGSLGGITVSRLAGAEYGLTLTGLSSSESVTWVIQKLFDSFKAPLLIDGKNIYADCTVGASLYPNDGHDVETLIRNAVTARQHAVEKIGRHKYMFFAQEMNQQSYRQMQLESEMRDAIGNGELVLYYQPAFDVQTRRITNLEALVRWNHPQQGLLGPQEFIPIAEHTGYINEIGNWVMREACSQMKKWEDQGFNHIRLAVNLSAVQLKSESFVEDTQKIIKFTGVNPSLLELEVTETALMDNVEQATLILQDFRSMGMHIAIDDFGTGYSSLSHLKHFYIDKLKIDKSFIDDVTRDVRDAAVVSATIAMAKLLGATVTAEGVETEEQLAFLRERECTTVQGHLLSFPVDSKEAARLLSAEANNNKVQPQAKKKVSKSDSTQVLESLVE